MGNNKLTIESGESICIMPKNSESTKQLKKLMDGRINRGRSFIIPYKAGMQTIHFEPIEAKQKSCVNCGAPLKRSICEYCC